MTRTPRRRYAYLLQRPDAPQILDLYRQGLTCSAIAEQLGRNATYVNRVVLAAGLPRPLRLHPQLLALHEQGLSPTEIARRLGLKSASVRQALLSRDLIQVRFPNRPPEVRRQAIELHRAGRSCSSVAHELGVHRNTVYRWMREAAQQRDGAGR